MKYLDPSADQVLVPLIISVRADTAQLLSEMAKEMKVSIDEILSSIAEDAVIGLERDGSFLDDVYIPDKCSREDLLNAREW